MIKQLQTNFFIEKQRGDFYFENIIILFALAGSRKTPKQNDKVPH
jgi:hypothetical protein